LATGTIEREAAMTMIVRRSPGSCRLTLGADKLMMCTSSSMICATSTSRRTSLRTRPTEPRRSARTTRHPGYAISQQKHKLTEEPSGWAKTIGALARPMLRGVARLQFKFTLTMAACNLIRLPKLLGVSA
jgi:hypothetical protein